MAGGETAANAVETALDTLMGQMVNATDAKM
jgi:hypothetical protein